MANLHGPNLVNLVSVGSSLSKLQQNLPSAFSAVVSPVFAIVRDMQTKALSPTIICRDAVVGVQTDWPMEPAKQSVPSAPGF